MPTGEESKTSLSLPAGLDCRLGYPRRRVGSLRSYAMRGYSMQAMSAQPELQWTVLFDELRSGIEKSYSDIFHLSYQKLSQDSRSLTVWPGSTLCLLLLAPRYIFYFMSMPQA